MRDEEGLNPALQRLESALGQTRPTQTGLDRDLLMFNAGRATARPNRPWQVLSGALGLLLLCAVFLRPEQSGLSFQGPVADSGTSRISRLAAQRDEYDPSCQQTYLRLRDQVLQGGVESLPPDPGLGSTGQSDRRQDLVDILSS